MPISENRLKWAIRLYPPLLFQRIWVKSVAKDFKGVEVVIRKSWFNKNYNQSIFGGTLFSAADPFFPVLFHQIFTRRGHHVIVWLKSAQVQYLKPAMTSMHFNISISDETVDEAEQILLSEGKFVQTFPVEILNEKNELCVLVQCEAYARLTDK